MGESPTGSPNPHLLFPNGIYFIKNQSLSLVLSIQEYEPGKFLLRNPLTYKPIIKSSSDSLNSLVSGWTITPLALSHSLQTQFERDNKSKPCFIPQFHSIRDEECKVYQFRDVLLYCNKTDLMNCHSNIEGFVNFCGCTYAVNHIAVYLVDKCGSKPLTCLNPSAKPHRPSRYTKRFVVSDGDLYLVFNFIACHFKPNSRHRCCIYKLVMDDLKCPTCYTMESVTSLGDRAFFFNWDCSFSISTGHLPPNKRQFVEDRIFIAKSANSSRVYSPQGEFLRTLRSNLALFKPPPDWIKELNGLMHK